MIDRSVRYLPFILAVLLLIGCAPERTHLLHGDLRFSPSERYDIETAAARWTSFTGGLEQIVVIWDGELGAGDGITLGTGPQDGPPILGHTAHQSLIYIQTHEGVMQVATHEMGHMLGLSHVDFDHSVMFHTTYTDRIDLFSAADRAECVRVGVCSESAALPVEPSSSPSPAPAPAPEPRPACDDGAIPMTASDGVLRCRPAAAVEASHTLFGDVDCQAPLVEVAQTDYVSISYSEIGGVTHIYSVEAQFVDSIHEMQDDQCVEICKATDITGVAYYTLGKEIPAAAFARVR